MDFNIDQMIDLLGQRIDDPDVASFIDALGRSPEPIGDDSFVELRSLGLSVMFRRSSSAPGPDPRDAEPFFLLAYHFHRQGHEGHSGYEGPLPIGIALELSERELIERCGPPHSVGGGGHSALSKRAIPRWLEYVHRGVNVHCQLGSDGLVEMVTLHGRPTPR